MLEQAKDVLMDHPKRKKELWIEQLDRQKKERKAEKKT